MEFAHMKYTMGRIFLVALSCCTLLTSANTVSAGWGHLRGGGSVGGASYGSYGSSGGGYAAGYGSSGGYGSYSDSYGSSGGSSGGYYGGSSGGSSGGYAGGSSGGGGHVGLFRRLAAHMHAKHARRASYGSSGNGSSGGSYAGYGSSGGSSGGYVTSYGSSGYGSSGGYSGGAVSYGSSGYSTSYGSSGGSYGSSGGVVVPGASVPYESGYLGVSNQSPASAASLASHQTESSDAIYLNVDVPPAAKVFVNNLPTSSIGASRQFVSRGLQPGKKYKFVVRAEVLGADGNVASEEKTVTMTAGQRDELSFVSLAQTPVQTIVTLNVPAEAKVILAGNSTAASGATRTFRTSQLKAGERWDDYVVEVHHDGKVKRETLRLVAGDDVALTFNFDDDKSLVASR